MDLKTGDIGFDIWKIGFIDTILHKKFCHLLFVHLNGVSDHVHRFDLTFILCILTNKIQVFYYKCLEFRTNYKFIGKAKIEIYTKIMNEILYALQAQIIFTGEFSQSHSVQGSILLKLLQ